MLGFSYPGQTYPAGYPHLGDGEPPWIYGNVVTFEREALAGPQLTAQAITGPSLTGEGVTAPALGGEGVAGPGMDSEGLTGPAFDDEEFD